MLHYVTTNDLNILNEEVHGVKHLFFKIGLLLLIPLIYQLSSSPITAVAADEEIIAPSYVLRNEQGQHIKSPLSFVPGTTHTLTLIVSNPGDDARISFDINNEQTSDDGQLDLMPATNRLLAGAIKADKIYSINSQDKGFILNHNKKRTISITVTMPVSPIKGQQNYLASLTATPKDNLSQVAGQSITIPMNIRNHDGKLERAKLHFSNFVARDYSGRRGFMVRVSNPCGETYRAKKLSGKISGDMATAPIIIRTLHAVEVAPYSYFNFFIPYATMSLGNYHLNLSTSNGENQNQELQTNVQQVPGGISSSEFNKQAEWEKRLLQCLAIIGPFVIIAVLIGRRLSIVRRTKSS